MFSVLKLSMLPPRVQHMCDGGGGGGGGATGFLLGS